MIEHEQESVEFPVVLYDGERQTNVGTISINPSLDFKQFQKMLKETVGISYNNLTTYLVDNNTSSERQKILITGKVNFAIIVLERNSFFLVVLKRSRRDRRRKVNNNKQTPLVPIVTSDLIGSYGYGYGYEDRFSDIEMIKQSYINSVLNCKYGNYYSQSFPRVQQAYVSGRSRRELCKECMIAEEEGSKAAFHFCVYDDVISGGFRSPVGPICRPV